MNPAEFADLMQSIANELGATLDEMSLQELQQLRNAFQEAVSVIDAFMIDKLNAI